MKRLTVLVALVLLLAPAAARADGIGIVLIHGKQGGPNESTLAYLTSHLQGAGFKVNQPDMCWDGRRIYDRTLLDCMADIDASVARLKTAGAASIVVAGHSMGGYGAILYGSLHDGLKGIVALAPAPGPLVVNQPVIVQGLAQARQQIAAGHGDVVQTFGNSNTNLRGIVAIEVHATPNIYLSFFDMSGPANMVSDTAKLKAPILWVSGTSDPSQFARTLGFDKAPASPMNLYLQISAGHMDTPDRATDAVVAWLQQLAKS